jgi:DNA-binding GntR family transcriptional regulator
MKRLNRESAADLVATEVRRAILTGAMPPGSRIKPTELAAQLGVSRMPIRQALSLLEREGLVKTDRWRGTIVTRLDAALILNVYHFREILERAVAATLAQKPFDSARVRSVIAEGRQVASTGDITQMLDLDLRFHTTLYDAFGNSVLSDVMVGLWGHVRRVMHAAVVVVGYRSEIWDEHEAIVDAIDARDAERASALAGDHIANASRVALRNLEALNSTGPHPFGVGSSADESFAEDTQEQEPSPSR